MPLSEDIHADYCWTCGRPMPADGRTQCADCVQKQCDDVDGDDSVPEDGDLDAAMYREDGAALAADRRSEFLQESYS